jgi:hypothetical protein
MARGIRRRKAVADYNLTAIDVHNAEIVRVALGQGHGVLITPNHATHADSYTMADACGSPLSLHGHLARL